MNEWFFRVKGFRQNEEGLIKDWGYSPILTGFVKADTKEAARKLVEADLSQALPMRVKRSEIGDKYPFFIAIYPSDENNHFTKELKRKRVCQNQECRKEFTKIEKDILFDYQYAGGQDCCSLECHRKSYQQNQIEWALANNKSGVPVIYKITNRKSGKCYVGQTQQPFTLRWWQHLNHNDTQKFGVALTGTDITEWTFEILEVVPDVSKLTAREKFYIEKFDCVKNGYNTQPIVAS